MNLKKSKFILITILVLLIIVIISLIPKIYLVGDKDIEIALNEEYKEKGANAYSFYFDISDRIEIKGKVNNKKVGDYKIQYVVNFFNIDFKRTRIVKVIDNEAPVIKLADNEDVVLCPNSIYEEKGFIVTDNYDKDLTDKVIKYVLDDKIVYRVKDSSGNIGIATRNVTFQDNEAPIIELNNPNMTLYQNQEFVDPGFVVKDNCDDISVDEVKVFGNVDTSKIGEYEIKYLVSDKSGNASEIIRTINIISKPKDTKVIYLTFDDGPSSSSTSKILDILKEEKVKATFFVINRSDDLNYLIKREYDEGHAVALHSYTHDYKYIYTSEDNYFNDLENIQTKVKDITGYESKIIRFPGGSSNTVSRFNNGIMSRLAIQTQNRGYRYFDWNVDSSDAGGAKDRNDVYFNVINHLNNGVNIVLMHDFENNNKTVDALKDIIHYGKENGYTFEKITEETKQIKHKVIN